MESRAHRCLVAAALCIVASAASAMGGGASYFCTQTKPTSVPGCVPDLSVTDLTLSPGSWNVTDVPLGPASGGQSIGIFIFKAGVGIGQSTFNASTPFGVLCMNAFKRSAPFCATVNITGGGTNVCAPGFPSFSPSCNGGALNLSPGEDVNLQAWYRDPGVAGNASFTNGAFYTIQ